jgi:hypothetical protein
LEEESSILNGAKKVEDMILQKEKESQFHPEEGIETKDAINVDIVDISHMNVETVVADTEEEVILEVTVDTDTERDQLQGNNTFNLLDIERGLDPPLTERNVLIEREVNLQDLLQADQIERKINHQLGKVSL